MSQPPPPPAPAGAPPGGVPGMGGFTGQPPAAGAPGAPGAPAGDPAAQPQGAAAQINTIMAPTTGATTPQDMLSKAQALAQSMIALPPGEYQSQMQQLKARDPQIWAQVKAVKEDIEQQAKQRGGAMLLSQEFGKQAAQLYLRSRQRSWPIAV